jgi:hypothetical protein
LKILSVIQLGGNALGDKNMNPFIVKERNVVLMKDKVGKYIELCGVQRDDSGKVIDNLYLNLEVDGNGELFVSKYFDENEEYSCESLEDLANWLRIHYNTHLEAGAYFYLKLMLKVEFDYQN